MVSIRKFLSVSEIIEFLEKERNLIYPDEESKNKFKNYLEQYNYNFFVKGLKNKKMFEGRDKYKKEFDSNQVRYLFDLDRKISSTVFEFFKSLELLFNNSLTIILSKEITRRTQVPYISSLSENDFNEIFTNYPNVYRSTGAVSTRNYFALIVEFYKNFQTISDFDEIVFRNKDAENPQVLKMIERPWFTKDKNYLYSCTGKKRDWIYVELFSLSYLWTYGQLTRIYRCLNDELKTQVIKAFSKHLNKLETRVKIDDVSFCILNDCFLALRNTLAHNANIMKFTYEIGVDAIQINISKLLGYKKDKTDNKIKLNLYDLITLIEKIIGCSKHYIVDIIKNDIKNKRENSDHGINDLLLEIIEDETGIKNIKDFTK